MKIILTKSQYEEKKEEILNNGDLTVSTKSITSRSKLTHKTTIACEICRLILEIKGDSTTYSYIQN